MTVRYIFYICPSVHCLSMLF